MADGYVLAYNHIRKSICPIIKRDLLIAVQNNVRVPTIATSFYNLRSERDLRKCKSRQKMSGGFRTQAGCSMYCDILSVIETAKRSHINPFDAIADILQGNPCFDDMPVGEL